LRKTADVLPPRSRHGLARVGLLLEERELVRQIRLSDRHSYFALNAPGRCCDYLVCRNCGIVADLPALAPMVELERQLAAARGFEISHHELEIYGTCSDCRRLGKEKYESIKN
jgi:Fur family transcriptional regulator, peroxide stress response regulator